MSWCYGIIIVQAWSSSFCIFLKALSYIVLKCWRTSSQSQFWALSLCCSLNTGEITEQSSACRSVINVWRLETETLIRRVLLVFIIKSGYTRETEQTERPKESMQTQSHKTSAENKLNNLDQDNFVSDFCLFLTWMEAAVLSVNNVSVLMNSTKGQQLSAGGEPVTANTWGSLSHANRLCSLAPRVALENPSVVFLTCKYESQL